MSNQEINQYIDHTLLKPTATKQDIIKLCDEAKAHRFKSVCVPPFYLELAKKNLINSDVLLCTVIGFPFGYDHVATKMEAIMKAVSSGADELDVVINIPAVKSGDWDTVESEIDSISTITKLKNNKVLKIIFETAYMTVEELENLCNLCLKYNVDFAKTSTGYAPEGAKIEDVKLMKSILKDKVGIKASGGIKLKKQALAFIEAGATRIGTSSGIEIVK